MLPFIVQLFCCYFDRLVDKVELVELQSQLVMVTAATAGGALNRDQVVEI